MSSNHTYFLEGIHTDLSDKHNSIRDLLLPILVDNEDSQRVCAIFDQNKLILDHLVQKARKVAKSLRSYKLVAICMHPSFEFIITLCGVILRGIPYVPLEPTLPHDRLAYILNDSQASIVITDDLIVGRENFNSIKTVSFSQLCIDDNNMDYEMLKVNREDTFCLMYTSGSTGQPKGVHLPHRALLNRLEWQWLNFPFYNDVCCFKTSISFVDSIAEILAPLLRRIPIVILPKSLLLDIDQLTDVLALQHITRIVLVPSLLTVLVNYLQNSNKDLLDLHLVVSSGENLPLYLIESFLKLKQKFSPTCRLINLYGSTEVMADITCEIFESTVHLYDTLSFDGRTSIGYPIDNIRIDIIEPDEQGVGELVVRGEAVANGYHYRDVVDKTLSNKFHCDTDDRFYFYTGDLGKILNKRIIFYGRKDNQVKISGNRVDLSVIEFSLKQHCNCRQPIAIYSPSNEKIVVFLQENETPINLDRNSLATYLSSYEIPTQFIKIPVIPLLVSGKVNRQHLIDSLKTYLSKEETQEPQEESEKYQAFLQVFNDIGMSSTHMNQSFIAAGGSSLNVILLLAKLRRMGFQDLTVDRLLNATTLQEIFLHSINEDMNLNCFFEDTNDYNVVALDNVDKNEALHIITESFANLGEIDVLVHHNRDDLKLEHKQQWYSLLDERWSVYVKNGLSFGVFMNDGRLIGISLSNNLAHEPHLNLRKVPLIAPLFTMIETGENQLLEKLRSQDSLPQSILHNFLTAVNSDLKPEQRVRVMHFVEQHVLQMAIANQFQAVLTANAGSVTQQLAEHVFKYDINKILYVNEWCDSSGVLVFPHANRNHTVTISLKHLM